MKRFYQVCISYIFLIWALIALELPMCSAADDLGAAGRLDDQKRDALLWKITHEDMAAPSYLFGTMHLMKSGYLDKWPNVQKAFQEADRVVVEAILDSSKIMQVGRMGVMRNATYEALYDSATLDTVEQYLKEKLAMPVPTLKRMKPMQLAVLDSRKVFQQVNSPLKSADGIIVDQYFARRAKALNKEVIPLETMMEQSRMLFKEMSNKEQAELLLAQIRQHDKMASFAKKLLKYYRDRSLTSLHALYQEQDIATQNLGFLVEKRNKKWVSSLTETFKEGNAFAAVGALHLPGKEGILNLLEEKGFEVQPLPVK